MGVQKNDLTFPGKHKKSMMLMTDVEERLHLLFRSTDAATHGALLKDTWNLGVSRIGCFGTTQLLLFVSSNLPLISSK